MKTALRYKARHLEVMGALKWHKFQLFALMPVQAKGRFGGFLCQSECVSAHWIKEIHPWFSPPAAPLAFQCHFGDKMTRMHKVFQLLLKHRS